MTRETKGPRFAVGDKVDVHPSYAAKEPERDCSGQAVIAAVSPGLFGGEVYGVAFPTMQPGFNYYWIPVSLLRHSESSD